MYDREWKEVLDYVQDLNDENIIGIIEEKLYAEHREVYEEWWGDRFNVNHSFFFRNGYMDSKCTSLHISAFYGAGIVVDALLKKGANVNAVDEEYITPLHYAAGNGHTNVVKILLKQKGINVDAVDQDGETPLHWAARFGSEDATEVLLKEGAKINATDKEKVTPLHLATRFNNKNVIKFLLREGANPLLQDDHYRIPKDSVWDEEVRQFFEDEEKRRLLKLKIIIAITTGFVAAVFETVVTVWFSRGNDIRRISMVLTVITIIALAVGMGTYMKLDKIFSTEPSTMVNRAQTMREEEQIQEL